MYYRNPSCAGDGSITNAHHHLLGDPGDHDDFKVRQTQHSRAAEHYRAECVRILLSFALIAAAVLKGYQIATEPLLDSGTFTSRLVLIAVINVELFLGLWLITGLYSRLSWWLSVGCFSTFACRSFFQVLAGEASCGCFGSLDVSPRMTLILDIAAIGALFYWRPAGTAFSELCFDRGQFRMRHRRLLVITMSFVGVSVLASGILVHYSPAVLSDRDFIRNGQPIVLEPWKWIGRPFPLLRYIDIADRLQAGNWHLLLYRHDCRDCQMALAELHDASYSELPVADHRIALVELAPYSTDPLPTVTSHLHGHLADGPQWFAKLPVFISLSNGTVTAQWQGRPRTFDSAL